MTTATATTWTISWEGRTWTDDDLTGQHLGTLAIISGDDRFQSLQIDEPTMREYPKEGYMRLMNMLATLIAVDAVTDDMDDTRAAEALAQALKSVQQAKADDILDAVRFS